MINQELLQKYLTKYKQNFPTIWKEERYKWVAVKHFQDNWDINAEDFPEMLKRSLDKTWNLLASNNNYPGDMITKLAQLAPMEVRAMFVALFDESKNVIDRVMEFKNSATELSSKQLDEEKSHYQSENAISTYLWLRYPDKYTIYKYGEARNASKKLESSMAFKRGAYEENLRNHIALANILKSWLSEDDTLTELLKSEMDDECYADPELTTMTTDLVYYISRYEAEKASEQEKWIPENYSPNLSVEDWQSLLENNEVFNLQSLKIMKRLRELGGAATCTELANKYGRTTNYYNAGSSALAKRVLDFKEIPPYVKDGEITQYWPVLYTGRYTKGDEMGTFVWKLRDELKEALDEFDLSMIPLYEESKENQNIQNVSEDHTDEYNEYSKESFLSEVYMSEERYDEIVSLLLNKKNIILQGAPGVGKTFAAKRLAYSIMGVRDDSRIELVQFHQNYSYEDFVQGYRPVDEGFALKDGTFLKFCEKAAAKPDQDFFFIIDEINRGNLSKIFGELLMLIEKDYRGTSVTLAGNGKEFSVPKNLYLIGMMNTADRSLALIDYALRRRFSFVKMEPAFDSEGFSDYREQLDNEMLDELIQKVKELNVVITSDRSLGKGFVIGHSYFCGMETCDENRLRSIVDHDLLPMLSEYWFDDETKYKQWEGILKGTFQ